MKSTVPFLAALCLCATVDAAQTPARGNIEQRPDNTEQRESTRSQQTLHLRVFACYIRVFQCSSVFFCVFLCFSVAIFPWYKLAACTCLDIFASSSFSSSSPSH